MIPGRFGTCGFTEEEGGGGGRALRTTGFNEGGTGASAESAMQVSVSAYHDVAVTQLQAVEHPRRRRQQGADGQGEGQTLHVASSHHFHLQRKTKRKNKVTQDLALAVSSQAIVP